MILWHLLLGYLEHGIFGDMWKEMKRGLEENKGKSKHYYIVWTNKLRPCPIFNYSLEMCEEASVEDPDLHVVVLLRLLITTRLEISWSVETYIEKVISTTHKLTGIGLTINTCKLLQ